LQYQQKAFSQEPILQKLLFFVRCWFSLKTHEIFALIDFERTLSVAHSSSLTSTDEYCFALDLVGQSLYEANDTTNEAIYKK
jgi:hypothetical protein